MLSVRVLLFGGSSIRHPAAAAAAVFSLNSRVQNQFAFSLSFRNSPFVVQVNYFLALQLCLAGRARRSRPMHSCGQKSH